LKLPREFYECDTLAVARELLGKYLVHHTGDGTTIGKIVEVEAYIGPDDAAAHTFGGLRTGRTEAAFGPGGYAYVYLIYGIHCCFNIVTSTAGKPEVVLVRALEPVEGHELMRKRRNTPYDKDLCSGPGKLCCAMGITRAENAVDLCGNRLYLLDNCNIPENDIIATPRMNIDYAGEAKDYPWRYIIKGNSFVSRGRFR